MAEKEKGGKGKKKHLHKIETIAAHDGTFHHHHHYKENPEDTHISHVREHAASSMNPDEAGEHVAEQFAMNQGSGNEQPGAGDQEAHEPDAGADQGNPSPME